MLAPYFAQPTGLWSEYYRTGRNRIRASIIWRRLYEGIVVQDYNVNNPNPLMHKMKHNVALPIVNTSAEFLAGKAIKFQIHKNPTATDRANEIWNRFGSGADSFLDSATSASIYGDACMRLTYNDDDEIITQWLDPITCFPTFDNRKDGTLDAFVMAFQDYDQTTSGWTSYFEEWKDGIVHENRDKMDEIVIGEYDEARYKGPPMVWIPNLKIKGDLFGRSDIGPVNDLVIQYDHLLGKVSETVDYYASPNMYMKGVRKSDSVVKNHKTVYFLPSDGDMGFIEWKGNPPGIEEHFNDVRNTLSEMTSVPKIAFSNYDFKNSDLSGVALKVLFGPLLKRTERKWMQSWGPGIRRMMQMALAEEGIQVKYDDIVILIQNPLPNNTKEDWEIGVMQNLLGVSNEQIQRERGYTEDQIDQMFKERQKEKEQDIALAVKQAVETAAGIAAVTPDPATPGGKPTVGKSVSGGLKQQSAKAKEDHTVAATPGKASGVAVTGRSAI